MATSAARARVGVVIIGRNEAARLPRVIDVAVAQAAVVIYVDSNSTDNSRELAEARGARVIHMTEGPFTPSRGRQIGFDALVRDYPELPYVQFIDGDCVLESGWVERACRRLDEHPETAVVFGRRREEQPRHSVYNRVMDLEWATPPGPAANFGGDYLARIEAVREAGGYPQNMFSAEDKDLAFRIRAGGGQIECLDVPMTGHDVRMTRLREFWRRGVRGGYGFLEVGWRYRHSFGRAELARFRGALLYGLILPLGAMALAVWWPWGLIVVALLYARVLYSWYRWARRRGAGNGTALAAGVLGVVCMPAMLIGAARYLWDESMRKGQRATELSAYRKG